MSTGTDIPAAAPTGPITLDQFAAELVAEQTAAAAPEEEEEEDLEASTEEPEDDSAEEVAADAEEEDAEPEVEASQEEVPPPQSWSKEDREAWSTLTPEVQKVVLKREADRDKAIAQTRQQAAELAKQVQTFAQRAEEYAHLGADAFEARWREKAEGPINWAIALQTARTQEEFQEILKEKAVYEAEKAQLEGAQKRAQEQSQLARSAFLAQEWKALEEIAPELADPKEGKARREKIVSYLSEQGIPAEVLPDIGAIELKLAWKAMRFDEMDTKAKAAAKLPRRNPTATPPKAIKASGTGDASPNRNLQALSQKLTKSGKLDDFVALTLAEEEQKARKKAR